MSKLKRALLYNPNQSGKLLEQSEQNDNDLYSFIYTYYLWTDSF